MHAWCWGVGGLHSTILSVSVDLVESVQLGTLLISQENKFMNSDVLSISIFEVHWIFGMQMIEVIASASKQGNI